MKKPLHRRLFNLPLLYWHRNGWRVNPTYVSGKYQKQVIDRPIFLLGIQGGGLTFISRVLRRHSTCVSVTGNNTYWAGPDEMQNVLGSILPTELTGLHHKIPHNPQYSQRDGLYAINDLLPLYRQTKSTQTPQLKEKLQHAIQLALNIHAKDTNQCRFVDKSQTFTVRLSLVNKLLEQYQPYFILLSRNPYAICYRYAMKDSTYLSLDIPSKKRFELAAQHWANSFRCAIEDAKIIPNLITIRFEDFLNKPEKKLLELCDFLDLPYENNMLPAPNQNIPLGSTGSSKGDRKWYPIRNDVNQVYLDQLERWMIDAIKKYVEPQARNWGYSQKGSQIT